MTVANPRKMVELEVITRVMNPEDQIQQNGVDLTVKAIDVVDTSTPCIITESYRRRPNTTPLQLVEVNIENEIVSVYKLEAGKLYDVLFEQKVDIPADKSGLLIQRSSVNRMGCIITSGWWDSGFQNYIWAIIRPAIDIYIGEKTRLAQLVLFDSDSANMYNGIYKEKN